MDLSKIAAFGPPSQPGQGFSSDIGNARTQVPLYRRFCMACPLGVIGTLQHHLSSVLIAKLTNPFAMGTPLPSGACLVLCWLCWFPYYHLRRPIIIANNSNVGTVTVHLPHATGRMLHVNSLTRAMLHFYGIWDAPRSCPSVVILTGIHGL